MQVAECTSDASITTILDDPKSVTTYTTEVSVFYKLAGDNNTPCPTTTDNVASAQYTVVSYFKKKRTL